MMKLVKGDIVCWHDCVVKLFKDGSLLHKRANMKSLKWTSFGQFKNLNLLSSMNPLRYSFGSGCLNMFFCHPFRKEWQQSPLPRISVVRCEGWRIFCPPQSFKRRNNIIFACCCLGNEFDGICRWIQSLYCCCLVRTLWWSFPGNAEIPHRRNIDQSKLWILWSIKRRECHLHIEFF